MSEYTPKQWIINNLFTKTLIEKLSKAVKKPFDSQYVNIDCYMLETLLILDELETSYNSGQLLYEEVLGGQLVIGVLFNYTDIYYLTSTSVYENDDDGSKEVYLIYTGNSKSVKVTVNGNNEETVEVKKIEYVPNETITNDFKVEISTDGQTTTVENDVTVADIVSAAESDKHVYAKVTVNYNGIIAYQRFELTVWASGLGNYLVTFGSVQEDDETAIPVCIKGENTGGSDSWSIY